MLTVSTSISNYKENSFNIAYRLPRPSSKHNPFSTWRLHVAWINMVSVHTSSTGEPQP